MVQKDHRKGTSWHGDLPMEIYMSHIGGFSWIFWNHQPERIFVHVHPMDVESNSFMLSRLIFRLFSPKTQLAG